MQAAGIAVIVATLSVADVFPLLYSVAVRLCARGSLRERKWDWPAVCRRGCHHIRSVSMSRWRTKEECRIILDYFSSVEARNRRHMSIDASVESFKLINVYFAHQFVRENYEILWLRVLIIIMKLVRARFVQCSPRPGTNPKSIYSIYLFLAHAVLMKSPTAAITKPVI